jgi:ketosteroid isomerase-like protein
MMNNTPKRISGGPRYTGSADPTSAQRALFGLLLVLCVLWGCEGARSADSLAQQWLDALNSHDPQRVMQLMDADATFSEPPPAKPLGTEPLRQWLTQVWSLWKDQVYTPKTIIVGPESLAVEWHLQQTSPKGTVVTVDGVTILEVSAGRVHSARNYYNTGIYLQFMKSE